MYYFCKLFQWRKGNTSFHESVSQNKVGLITTEVIFSSFFSPQKTFRGRDSHQSTLILVCCSMIPICKGWAWTSRGWAGGWPTPARPWSSGWKRVSWPSTSQEDHWHTSTSLRLVSTSQEDHWRTSTCLRLVSTSQETTGIQVPVWG